MKSRMLIFLLMIFHLSCTYGVDNNVPQKTLTKKNEVWKEIDQKIFIYHTPPHRDNMLTAFGLGVGSLASAGLLGLAIAQRKGLFEQPDHLIPFYGILGLHMPVYFTLAAYFGRQAYKKRNQTEEPLIILSLEGFEYNHHFYRWNEVTNIEIWHQQRGWNRGMSFRLQNKIVCISTTECAISNSQIIDLVKRFIHLTTTKVTMNGLAFEFPFDGLTKTIPT